MKSYDSVGMILIGCVALACTIGCKSNCETAVDKALTYLDGEAKKAAELEASQKAALESCERLSPKTQKCLADAADAAVSTQCLADEFRQGNHNTGVETAPSVKGVD